MPLVDTISAPRLNTYITSFSCSENSALDKYHWNQALSSELYVLLHNIEVCLRNRIHTALSLYTSEVNKVAITDNYNWYDFFNFEIPDKKDRSKKILGETGKAIELAKKKLRRKKLPENPQNVISNIDFGTWRHVLTINSLIDNKTIQWSKITPKIFIYYKDINNSKKRRLLMDRLREIGLLRNRVAHLEPVWKYKQRTIGENVIAEPKTPEEIFSNLQKEIMANVRFLKWLCEETHDFYVKTASFQRLQALTKEDYMKDFKL